MYFKGAGVIGDKGMKPTITWQWKKRKGQTIRVPFIRFSMFVEDQTKTAEMNPVTNYMQRPREIVQVILPETQRGQTLFQSLSPGRQVYIEGRLTCKPGIGKNHAGEEQIYANLQVYMNDLQFMDSSLEKQVERMTGLIIKAQVKINGSKLTEEAADIIKTEVNQYLAIQREPNGPPRLIEDKTTSDEQNTNTKSNDPDGADFAE